MDATTAPRPLATIREIASDIKLAHSVFAMPFALLGAFLAGRPAADDASAHGSWRRFLVALVLIVGCMVLARTVAMLSNRLLDRHLDRKNPRTAGRAIPSGRLDVRGATAAMLFCAAGFMLCCAAFGVLHANWWPTVLGLPVLAWISAYPLLKRFTWLCHIYLGASLAMTPIAAAMAVHPDAVLAQSALWLLSGAVLCWVAGFDVIYALQDVEIDRRDGLHSIPAHLGTAGALWVSRALHAIALALLILAWRLDTRLGLLFAIGIAVTAALLVAEHAAVATRGLKATTLAFFTLNGIVSCVLGAMGIVDLLGP